MKQTRTGQVSTYMAQAKAYVHQITVVDAPKGKREGRSGGGNEGWGGGGGGGEKKYNK